MLIYRRRRKSGDRGIDAFDEEEDIEYELYITSRKRNRNNSSN